MHIWETGPVTATLSIFAGTSTLRPAESVNVTTSPAAADDADALASELLASEALADAELAEALLADAELSEALEADPDVEPDCAAELLDDPPHAANPSAITHMRATIAVAQARLSQVVFIDVSMTLPFSPFCLSLASYPMATRRDGSILYYF